MLSSIIKIINTCFEYRCVNSNTTYFIRINHAVLDLFHPITVQRERRNEASARNSINAISVDLLSKPSKYL
jgi:hypothetical protein